MSRPPRAVIVHGPDHLEAVFAAAAAAGREVTALIAAWAGAAYGPLYLAAAVEAARARHPRARVRVVLDCADDAGAAMAALRTGWRRIAFAGRADVRARIAGLAEATGAELLDITSRPLDLDAEADPEAALRGWLADCK